MTTSSFHSGVCEMLFRGNSVPMFLYDIGTLRIVAANQAALSKYGYTLREFRSMTAGELHPCDDAPTTDEPLLEGAKAPSCLLWTHAGKSGRAFSVEIRMTPFTWRRDKLCLLSALETFASSESNLKLVRSEEIDRALFDQCPFGIYRFNLSTLRYEQANPAMLRLLGCSHEEFCADPMPAIFVEDSARKILLAELQSKGCVRDFETSFKRKDGGALRVSISGYLCTNPETGEQYIQSYVRDTTRQHELEEEFRQSRSLEMVCRLAGGVAHDFNNITQSISLSCELALQEQVAPAFKSKLKAVIKQAARAAEITRQLLAFSRRQVLQPRAVNINECVRNALGTLTRAVGDAVSIELKLDEKVEQIFIDPDQLAVVLLHLADNARAAMPNGGQLRISTASLPADTDKLKSGSSQSCAVLTVSDTGIGMEDKVLARIFEPFFSTKKTTLTTGLGLATSHGIISQSNGCIECESSPGHGTTFRIYLPLARQGRKT